ncbi:putative secreted protein (Por secretion system target) [Breznakibacter xylanolyticus]|uniref:Putative secreted protein (Por secretion system target) n=1 Tax=Breznakibacter xylanolyticus TaxID=990 RepID=A0A2W7MSA6_9BACT|nr:T9SS type A sorting domain-containing protein [Breznakibacter xylanolyticus]PZX10828.1 putative secreted protein (Por secretion system target) [Breznakibacter xylanolyticus]
MKTTLLWLLLAGWMSVAAQIDCENASSITLEGFGQIETTTRHTSENGDMWYQFTPTEHARVTISSVGSTSDTYVLVYKSCPPADYFVFSEDYNGSKQSQLTFEGIKGTTYYICWKYKGSLLNEDYSWRLTTSEPVAGDFCSNAFAAQAGENNCKHTNGNDQWFRYIATSNRYLIISSQAATAVNTQCYIYGGCDKYHFELNSFKAYGVSHYAIPVIKDREYFIQWIYPGSDDNYAWNLAEGAVDKGNVCFVSKTAFEGFNISTHATDYPEWFTYTPTTTGEIMITSQDVTDIDTKVQVFADCSPVSYLKLNDDIDNTIKQSSVTFSATANTPYKIKWASPPVSGAIYSWSLTELANLSGLSCDKALNAVEGINRCEHSGTEERWFVYRPVISGNVTVTTSDKDVHINVYSSCDATTHIVSQTGVVSFTSEIDKLYYLSFTPVSSASQYNWTLSVVYDAQGTTCGNPFEAKAGENSVAMPGSNQPVWYSYTAREKSKVKFEGSNDVTLALYSTCSSVLKSGASIHQDVLMEEGETMIIQLTGSAGDVILNIDYSMILGTESSRADVGVSLLPNPNKGVFTIYGLGGDDARISIIGLDGRMYGNYMASGVDEYPVQADDLNQGMYIVLVQKGQEVLKFKMIKQL